MVFTGVSIGEHDHELTRVPQPLFARQGPPIAVVTSMKARASAYIEENPPDEYESGPRLRMLQVIKSGYEMMKTSQESSTPHNSRAAVRACNSLTNIHSQ